jgi:hypothetical protein
MPTNYLVRILLLAPSARQNAINTWVRNNLDAAGANWLSVGLNATGSGAATFYWFNAALTVPNFRLIAAQLLQMSSIALPGNFDSMTLAEKFTWFRSQFAAIRTATGIRLRVYNNDGVWDNPQDELTASGLKAIDPLIN